MPGTFNPPIFTGTVKRLTTNYSFPIPEFDAPGWGVAMEATLETLDSVIFAISAFGNVQGQWANATAYLEGQRVVDATDNTIWQCSIAHTSAASGSFSDDRTANPTYWTQFTTAAQFRGDWVTATNYNANEYITDSGRFGVVVEQYTSGASYNDDVTAGHVVTLIDTSAFSEFNVATVAAPAKTTLVNNDLFPIINSEDSDSLAKLTTANLYANVGAYMVATYPTIFNATATFTSALETKLNGIEALADVTDVDNIGSSIAGGSTIDETTLADDDKFGVVDTSASSVAKGMLASKLINWIMNKLGLHGIVVGYAGSTAPTYWALCYGQAVSRTTYSALFAKIGTTYGVGDGSTTFNLPDYRGRVEAGKDNMGGVSANRLTAQTGGVDGDTLGAVGGAETHTLSEAQIPAHAHDGTTGVESAGHTHNASLSWPARYGLNASGVAEPDFGSGDSIKGTANRTITTGNRSATHTHDFTTNNAGGGGAHNNVQPTIIMNKIIFTGVA